MLTACFFFAGDECGLCKWDPRDEHDSHRRAGVHAVYPHRGERAPSSCFRAGLPVSQNSLALPQVLRRLQERGFIVFSS